VTVKDYLAPVRLTSGLHYYYYVTRHASQNLALHELFLCPAILLAAAPRWSTAREAARQIFPRGSRPALDSTTRLSVTALVFVTESTTIAAERQIANAGFT
jgi:hypothetical protein